MLVVAAALVGIYRARSQRLRPAEGRVHSGGTARSSHQAIGKIVEHHMASAGHHYVPVMYLKRFCNKEGKIEVWDCFEGRSFCTNPKNAAKIHGYYTGETEASKEDDIIEERMSKLETEAAPVIERVIEQERLPCLEDWAKLCEFVCFLGHRTPVFRQFYDQVGKQVLVSILSDSKNYKKQAEIAGDRPQFSQDELIAMVESGKVKIQPHQNHYLNSMIKYATKALPLVFCMTPHIAISTGDFFITSDNPISRWNVSDLKPHPVWNHPDLQINFAISPRVALVFDHAPVPSILDVTSKGVAVLNARTVGTALRYVYSTLDEFAWEDSAGVMRRDRKLLQEVHGKHKKGQSLISEPGQRSPHQHD